MTAPCGDCGAPRPRPLLSGTAALSLVLHTQRDLRVLSSVLSLPDSVWKPLRQVCATALQTGKLGLREIRPHGWEKVRHGCATPNSVPLAVEKPSCLRGWNWAVCCEGRRFFLSFLDVAREGPEGAAAL